MNKDIVIMKLSEIIQFIEETTGEARLSQVELSPVPFSDEELYMTGFRVDTPYPMIHIKRMRKIKLFGATASSQQQIEYWMMNPDAEMWIDCDALDSTFLTNAISEFKKKLYKTTELEVIHVTYREAGQEITRDIAYSSRRIAMKEAMTIRKEHTVLSFRFNKAGNKDSHKISDLEFATAAL